MTATTSAPLTVCSIDPAAAPPASTSACIRSSDRSYPMTVWPAATRWRAIGPPMIPSPMNPMVLTRSSFLCEGFRSWRRRCRGPPAGARRRRPAGWPCTRGRCSRCIPGRRDPGAGRRAAAHRFPAHRARCVGDLHVSDPAGVLANGGARIVAVDVEVVEVGEQPEIRGAALGAHPVDHPDDVLRRLERIERCAADGFQKYRGADSVRGRRGVGQVVGRDVILGRRRQGRIAIAVEGVEGTGSEKLRDADGNGNAFSKVLGQSRDWRGFHARRPACPRLRSSGPSAARPRPGWHR